MALNFNEESTKPRFVSERHPELPHAYLILEHDEKTDSYQPAGQYTVLDTAESQDLTEKKVMNLISLLNGRKNIMDLSNLTESRLLYNIVSKGSETEDTKIIFRTYTGKTVSEENAVLTIRKGVFNDDG